MLPIKFKQPIRLAAEGLGLPAESLGLPAESLGLSTGIKVFGVGGF